MMDQNTVKSGKKIMDTSRRIVSKPNIPFIDLEKEESNRKNHDKKVSNPSLVQSTSEGSEYEEPERETFNFRRIRRNNTSRMILDYFGIVPKNGQDPDTPKLMNFKRDPDLMRFRLNENALFVHLKKTMMFDPMDQIQEELEKRKKRFKSNVSDNDSDDSNDSDDVISLDSDEHRLRPFNLHHTLNVGSSDGSDDDRALEPVCRRRAFRNEYFYINRNMNIFNLIRYSFASTISQNFLKTPEGQKQVKKVIDNCRNMVTMIKPEEETAVASKILLISQQSIKQAKRSTHKFRNSRYHRQLNQGEKFTPLFYQTNFSFLKKGFDKNWFIEEQKINDDQKKMHLSIDHRYFRLPKKEKMTDDQKVYRILCMAKAYKTLSEEAKQLKNRKRIPKIKDPILKLDAELNRPGRPRLTIEKSIKTKIVQDDSVEDDNLKTIRTEPIKTFRMYDRNHPVPTDQFESYESFRKWERIYNEKKREIVNPFAGAQPYVKLHLAANKAGLVDMDLSILHDVDKLKAFWLNMKTNPQLMQENPAMRDLFQLISNHMNNRTQWIRMESTSSKYQEHLGQMTEALKDSLPRNIFLAKVRLTRRD